MTAPYVTYVRYWRENGTEYRRAIFSWWISPSGYYQEDGTDSPKWVDTGSAVR